MITITNLTVRIAGRVLLEEASVFIPGGFKAGFVGRNGAGKSTLFKVLTGEMAPETGEVTLPRNARIGQVAQEAPGTDESLIEIVLAVGDVLHHLHRGSFAVLAVVRIARRQIEPIRLVIVGQADADLWRDIRTAIGVQSIQMLR